MIVLKLLRKFFKILNGDNAPWQVFCGTLFGVLLGFLPVWPPGHGPAPLGLAILLVALVLNCHLGSVLLFWGLATLAALALRGPALAVGSALDDLAWWSRDVWILHRSLWSHLGWLGSTVIGAVVAPVAGLAMAVAAGWFRARVRPRLEKRRRMVAAGQAASHPLATRLLAWFFGL